MVLSNAKRRCSACALRMVILYPLLVKVDCDITVRNAYCCPPNLHLPVFPYIYMRTICVHKCSEVSKPVSRLIDRTSRFFTSLLPLFRQFTFIGPRRRLLCALFTEGLHVARFCLFVCCCFLFCYLESSCRSVRWLSQFVIKVIRKKREQYGCEHDRVTNAYIGNFSGNEHCLYFRIYDLSLLT